LVVFESRSQRRDPTGDLGQISNFALVPDGENAYFVGRDHKAVKGHVSRMAIGNNQFTQFPLDAAAYERMRGEVVNRGLDRYHCALRGNWIFVAQELKGALDVIESAL
jgi:hypothetical protein